MEEHASGAPAPNTEVEALKAELVTLKEKAALADQLASEAASWKAKAEDSAGKYSTFLELAPALGTVDPDVVSMFDAKYQALPVENRPTRVEWVAGLKAAPTSAPGVLRPWLGPVSTPTTVAAPPAPPLQPRVPGTPATPPPAPVPISAAEIKMVREKAVATGNWEPWRELSKTLRATKG